MAVKTLYFKEHEAAGMAHNPIGQLSSSSVVPSMAWWSNFGSQSIDGEPCDHNDQFMINPKHSKGNTTAHFTIFPDECKTMNDGQKSVQASNLHAHIDLGFTQPMMCAKYPPQCFGLFSAYGAQLPGRAMLPMATEDGPIFVNPKQYHAIIRRRKSRAKAVLKNKPTKKRKPFMHLSRHLHAMRRPRGTGGRFLNSKEQKDGISYEIQPPQQTASQSSEVLQSNSGTLNSSKDGNSGSGGGSNHSGTEVTSVYSRHDHHHHRHHLDHDLFPMHHFAVMMNTGHSIVMPSKWVTT